MVIAATSAIFLYSMCLVGISYGLGKHVWDINDDLSTLGFRYKKITLTLFICYLAYATAIAFTKLSIISSYLRFFPSQKFRRCMIITSCVVLAIWICSIFTTVFQCRPVSAAWDIQIVDGKCFDIINFFYLSSAFTIATDIVLCVAPLPYLWKMQLPLCQRGILCGLFGLGAL
jgi:hypothetical protein